MRATIINCFRIPLNLFVCIILYNVHQFPLAVMFGLCSIFLCVAALCQQRLMAVAHIAAPPEDRRSGGGGGQEGEFDRVEEFQRLLDKEKGEGAL